MLSVEKRKGDLVVRLTGDIDHNAASRLCLALDEAMGKDPDIRRLIFDMRGVEFMDSSGIGILIGRKKTMDMHAGKVTAVNLGERVYKIFEKSGLFQIISLEEEEK